MHSHSFKNTKQVGRGRPGTGPGGIIIVWVLLRGWGGVVGTGRGDVKNVGELLGGWAVAKTRATPDDPASYICNTYFKLLEYTY